MKKQKIIITIMTLLAVTLIVSPSVWAKNDNNSGVPFQALWDAIGSLQAQIGSLQVHIGSLQAQIDTIELIPGPPGEPAKIVTQVEKGLDLMSFPGASILIGPGIDVSISEPTDIVVLFTAEVIPPYITEEGLTGTMRLGLMCTQGPSIVSEEYYRFSGNRWMTPKQQANIHSVIQLSEPGEYTIYVNWYCDCLSSVFVNLWTMNNYRTTLIVP